jgi:hypothetical protein
MIILEIKEIKDQSKTLFKTYSDKNKNKNKNLLKKKHFQTKEEKILNDSSSFSKTKIHGIIFKKSCPIKKQKKNCCNCKNSQCLKLYCQCFSKFDFCDPDFCSCVGCANTKENEVF